ncbi:branched-chain amino acid ABC transporter permease [Paracoccus sp. S-4012]|uniref:branched-chain amino acid ABC transporter permease n=1 Tax=Paracoccus sp. S-4012 TaxID=2665648 RepID=UPI00132A3F40|nr:branched-chain amino acid ABC transporter permease [Paracoccus sp. S-4012]
MGNLNPIQILVDTVSVGGLYALTALGLGLIFSVMRLANFAHAELVTCAAYAVFALSGQPVAVAIVASVGTAMVLALATERLAFRPLRSADQTTMLIASFAVSMFIQKLLIFTVGSRPKPVDPLPILAQPIAIAGAQVSLLKLATILACIACLGALTYLLRRTSIGLHMRAAAEDFTMAQLVGVRANSVILAAFVLSGFLAAVVALLFVAQTGFVHPRLGVQIVLVGFVATVIGGLGSLPGAAAGGFLVGALATLLQALLPAELRPFREAFLFLIVILVLLFRPNGLWPAPGLKERV